MTATIHHLPVRFRPRLVTPSEALAALELSIRTHERVTDLWEQAERRLGYGAPVVVALPTGEWMK